MCGIAGVFDLDGLRPVATERLRRMCDAMQHRGPDGEGFYTAPGIGLGHRRLSVVDIDGGEQPMFDADRRVVTVFNGEIYNHATLRRNLSGRGHQFASRSDTEAILQAWRAWGQDGVRRLNGMFAFALWDLGSHVLQLARDPLGEKPLYYAVTADHWLVFASELPALLAGLEQEPQLRVDAVADYFAYGYVPDPKTIYADIHKLPPGHHLTISRGAAADLKPQCYWRLSAAAGPAISPEDAQEELAERLSRAVASRMQADVPLGAFLSGGVDSSGVVALMAQNSGRPVQTCAMGFADPAFDETAFAAMAADRYGTDHVREEVTLDALGLVDRLARAYGEPFADPSAVPTFLVSQAARKRVTVALSGDGGDEAFAGYRRYPFHLREEAVKRALPAGFRQIVFGALASIYPKADWAPRPLRAKATLEALAADRAAGYFRAVTVLPEKIRSELLSNDLLNEVGGYDPASVIRGHMDDADSDDPLRAAQYVDMQTWLAGRMLVKVDRASMANSLEVRPPLLDPDLLQWAVGLPERLKIQGFEGKWLLKKTLEPYLPNELLYRRKQGFSMPLSAWMRHGLEEKLGQLTASSGKLAGSGMFNMSSVDRLVASHRAGRADHSQALWALIMFEAFLAYPQRQQTPVVQPSLRLLQASAGVAA